MKHYKELIKLTAGRQQSFNLMLENIQNKDNPIIIETGCIRNPNSYDGDGMSTMIFDSFAYHHDAEYYSVDLNIDHVNLAKKMTKKAKITCSDSVKFLFDLNSYLILNNKRVDLLYLDSYDLDRNNPHPSSMHHIMELIAIWPSCGTGTIIAVDDNFDNGIGKGKYVKDFMALIGKKPIYDGYQIVWQL